MKHLTRRLCIRVAQAALSVAVAALFANELVGAPPRKVRRSMEKVVN